MPVSQAGSRPYGRAVIAVTLLITAALVLWTYGLSRDGGTHGLTPIFFSLFVTGDYSGLQCALLVVLMAALIPSRYPTAPLLLGIGRHPLWVAVGTTVVLSAGAWLVYQRSPLSMDEYSAVFQSRIFAAGHVAGQFPPRLLDWLIPRGFQNYFLNVARDTGRVTSAYWPSFALLMTPFTWLGIPWACNPVISGLTILSGHRLALRIFGDHESAGLAVLLTVASPVFFGDGISYYSMPAHLLANTVYALLLCAPTPRRALAAGVVGSVALTLHNPVPHMLFALPWIVSLLRRPGGARIYGPLLAGYLPLCLVLGLGWFWQTSPAGGGVSHVSTAFALPTTTLLLARAMGIAKVWAWAVPGLLVLACIGAWQWRNDRTCRLLTASAVVTLLGYFFVPFDQGHGWGYRYFHSAWIALPLLATAALTRVPRDETNAPSRALHATRMLERGAACTFLVYCALFSLTLSTGLRAMQIRGFVIRHQSQMPAYAGTEHRVIILDTEHSFYGRDLVQNDPWLRGDTIVMITHGAAADSAMIHANFPQLCQVYADRFGSVWSAGSATVTCSPASPLHHPKNPSAST